jgi:hypothetical protein
MYLKLSYGNLTRWQKVPVLKHQAIGGVGGGWRYMQVHNVKWIYSLYGK